jgi:hypothetical protein
MRDMDHDPALHRRAQQLLPAFLALGMSAFDALVVTAINTGIDAGLALRWLGAWSRACPAAILAAYLLRPLAWRAALAVATRLR